VQDGICQIGMSSRALTPDEAGLTAIPIALDGIVLTTACANPVSFLTSPQACAVFAGEVRDWQQLGGPSRRITVITREEGSGTRASFEEKVMTAGMPPDVNGRTRPAAFARDALVQDSNGAVREIVASDPAAIGYISFGLLDDRVRALALDGVAPSEEAIQQGRYPVVRRFLFLTNSHRPPASARQKQAVASFLDFALSPAGQQVLVEEGLVSILP
jgi:phosphate transport system substrate-binding protein